MALTDLLNGYGIHSFPLPAIAGSYKGKKLAVCGDAACVWDDLDRLGCRYEHKRGAVASIEYDFLTINKLVETFPGNIEHSYSNEPKLLDAFIAARRNEYRKEFEGPRHTHSCQQGTRWRWPWGGHGTSALGAALVGVGLGYDLIVLCGVPLDNGPHNGEPPWRKCAFSSEAASKDNEINLYWKKAKELAFENKVRSMSGRTKAWLGAPR